MMVELLAAALTGGHFSFEFDWSNHPGAKTPWTGQLLIVIDPSKGAGQNFAERSQELIRQMHGVGLKRLPGIAAIASGKSPCARGLPWTLRSSSNCGSWPGFKTRFQNARTRRA